MLRIKVIYGSLDASRIGFTSYMGTHSNPEGLTGLTELFTSGTERGFFNKALYITPLPN